ncbi:MAG: rod shape-determining protein MreD [Clostridia bacterium]|nr:rod shape-determining protein MreD [Lachnospiraceae bacterium]NCC00649.1 rod shape-determining protein MreD [Clostridia bacterium]NCD02661.1 rod shape-determining protein MreD [Clostridia bacterium]
MRRLIFYVAIVILAFFMQTGVFTHLALGGIVPNLFVICTASIGMIRGKTEGCVVGFFCGILMDALFAMYFGFYALVLAVLGYLTGYVKQIFYEEDMTLPIVIIGVADILYGIAVYLFSFLTRGRMDFPFYLGKIIIPETIYTLILAVFLYRLISWTNRRIEIKGSENRID